MANPCIIVFKGKEYSFEDFASQLHDGLLDNLIRDGIIDNSKFKGNATKKIGEPTGVQGERKGGDEGGKTPETGGRNRLLGETPSPTEGKTEEGVKAHKEKIVKSFTEQFSKKGLSQKEINGALALMEARAKSWASEQPENRTADEWYLQIADVKSGEFETDTEKQYQIEDKSGNKMTVKPINADVVNGFYSPLEKTINEAKQDKMPAKQWLDKFAKTDEAKWTGLADWLSQQQGSLTKQDVLDYLKNNRVEIVEVVKGEMGDSWKKKGDTYYSIKGNYKIKDLGDNEFEVWKGNSNLGSFDGLDYAKQKAIENAYESETNIENDTKFSEYQLEGEKENYKEVLVTLPSKVSGFKKKTYPRAMDLVKAIRYKELPDAQLKEIIRNEYNITEDIVKRVRESDNSPAELNDALYIIKAAEKSELTELSNKDFKSTHFDEPNILVHLRMNTRTDADGNKVLFLEEVQSDWGQKGKKEGFKDLSKPDLYRKAQDSFKKWEAENPGVNPSVWREQNPELAGVTPYSHADNRTHPAPFVTKTTDWVKLGLKVALKEAVKQGADKIAWTTGEQQNDRYDLSKQVDEVEVIKNGKEYSVFGKKDGRKMGFGEFEENQLSGVVGKELASKIINDYSGLESGKKRYKGDNLKVGGKGMIGFYGSPTEGKKGIVGEVAEKVFGQSVGEIRINKGEILNNPEITKGKNNDGDNAFFVIDSNGFKSQPFYNYGAAESFIQNSGQAKQPSITITPELKAQVEQGLALFQKNKTGKPKGAVETLKDGRVVIHALESPDFSTMVHEIAHVFEKDLTEQEQKTIKHFGGSEKFARAFERYLRDGKAPTPQLKTLFDKFKKWLTNIYQTITGSEIDVEITPEVKQIFDRLLTEQKTKVKEGEAIPTTAPPKEEKAGFEREKGKRSVAKRIIEGNAPERIKNALKEEGLEYVPSNLLQAQMKADAVVKKLGLDLAIEAIKDRNNVRGDVRAFLFESIRKELAKQQSVAQTLEESERLQDLQIEMDRVFAKDATEAGQFMRALREAYDAAGGYFNAEKAIEDYIKKYDKEPSKEDVEKFKEIEKQNKELSDKITKLEAELEQKESVQLIKEHIKRRKKDKTKYEKKYKRIADTIRKKLKVKPIQLKDSDGNPLDITKQALFDWNEIVEFFASSIEKTGKIIDSVNATIEHIKEQEWYQKLSKDNQNSVNQQIKDNLYGSEEEVKISNRFLRELVERGGIETIEDLVEATKKELGLDDKSDREIRDAITKYGETIKMSPDRVSESLRKMKRIGRLLSQIEDVRNQIRPLKSGLQRDKFSAEERKLQRELREEMKNLPPDEATLEQEIKTRLDAAKTRVINRIEDLKLEIEKGEKLKKSDKAFVSDIELDNLRKQLEELKKEHDEIFKNEEEEYRIKLNQAKQRVTKSIENYQRRIDEGDFAPRTKTILKEDEELSELRAKREAVRDEFEKLKYRHELENRTTGEKALDYTVETWNLTRALRATAEMSFIGLQGAYYTISNPIQATKAMKEMIYHMANEKNSIDWLHKLRSSKDYPIMNAVKLAISEPDAKLSAREEQFLSGWAGHILDLAFSPTKYIHPVIYEGFKRINPIKIVERAAISYMNTLRVQKFREGMALLEAQGKSYKDNPKDYEALADMINTMTGRSKLPFGNERLAKTLSLIMFSPRNTMSQIKTSPIGILPYYMSLGGQETAKVGVGEKVKLSFTKPSVAQKMLMKDYMKYMVAKAGIFALVAYYLDNDDDDETKVSYDPTSSDFMKFRMGDKAIDIWNGQVPLLAMEARMINNAINRIYGERKNVLGEYETNKGYGDIAWNWFKNKLNPSAQIAYQISSGKLKKVKGKYIYVDPYGKEIDELELLASQMYPIYWDTVNEIYAEKETSNLTKSYLTLLSFFNFVNPSYYAEPTTTAKKEMKKRKSEEDGESKDWAEKKEEY